MSDLQSIAVDLTDTAARAERDRLADRTDVIDKVGVLRCLPDDMHATTDMVAEFYKVSIESIRQTVKRNRDELDDDGYRVLSRAEFESDIASLSNLDPKVRSVGLYPRRAILRLGMLLRDSTVARQVRDYLLDAERAGGFVIPRSLPDALRAYAAEVEAHELTAYERDEARAQLAELEPKAAGYERFLSGDGTLAVGVVAKMVGTGQNKLFAELRNVGVLISKGPLRNTPYQQYMQHFDVKGWEYTREDGTTGTSYRTRVQPSGVEFIAKKTGRTIKTEVAV